MEEVICDPQEYGFSRVKKAKARCIWFYGRNSRFKKLFIQLIFQVTFSMYNKRRATVSGWGKGRKVGVIYFNL